MAGFHIEAQYLVIMGSTFLIMILLGLFFEYTRTGFVMRACFYNRLGARLVGINVRHISTVSFGMSAILVGGCVILVTPVLSMDFAQGTMLVLKGFCAARKNRITPERPDNLDLSGLESFNIDY